jgi:hypothetical protein
MQSKKKGELWVVTTYLLWPFRFFTSLTD